MPRASTEESEVKKRAPRRRVATPRAPRKIATKVAVAEEPVAEAVQPQTAPRRKAPTKLPLSPASPVALYEASRAKKSLYVSGSLFMLGLAIAAGIGYSDTGVINTAAVISERNAQLAAGAASAEGGTASVYIPVQNSASGPVDGGLVSSGEVPPLVPAASEVATSSASSTEAASSTVMTASSTEADLLRTEEVEPAQTETPVVAPEEAATAVE